MATSNPGCGTSFTKYIILFFNFLFCVSGLALIVLGTFINLEYGTYLSFADNRFARAEYFIIAVGVIVFVVGVFGCCGVARSDRRLIKTFTVMLSIAVVLEIGAGIMGYTYRNQVKGVAKKALKRGVHNYSSNTGAKHLMD